MKQKNANPEFLMGKMGLYIFLLVLILNFLSYKISITIFIGASIFSIPLMVMCIIGLLIDLVRIVKINVLNKKVNS